MTAIAARNLSRHRRRTVVNVLGIAAAVGSLVFFQAFYRGSYEELMFGAIIDYQSAHLLAQTPAFVEEDPDTYVSESSMIADWPDVRARLAGVDGVRATSARLIAPGFAGNGIRKRALMITGVDEVADRAVFRTLDRLSSGGHLAGPGQIIVGASLAALFGLGPGDQLRVQVRTIDNAPNIQSFTIAGLFTTGYPQIDRGMAFVGLPDLQDLLGVGDRVNRIHVRAASVDAVGSISAQTAGSLGILTVLPWTEAAAGILEHSRSDRMFMTIFLSILFVLALSTVAGTMFMAVFERTREIGTLRASGWQRGEVFRLFVIEASLIGIVGAAVGVLLGAAASLCLMRFPLELGGASSSIEVPFLKITARLDGVDVLVSALAGVMAAAVAGVAPARRAARIVIVKALAAH